MALDKVLKIYDEQGNPVDYDILASDVKFLPNGKDLPTKLTEMEDAIEDAAESGGYTPPQGGIPKTDLAPSVQTSLGLADTALQEADKIQLQAAINAVQTALNNLMNGQNVTDAIDTFNEVVDFLNGIDTDDQTLSNQLLALSNAITALQTALAGKISGIKANGASETLPVDQNGIVTLPPAGSTISPATNAPSMDGTANVGSSAKYAREDHVHPHDTTKLSKSDVSVETQGDGTVDINVKDDTYTINLNHTHEGMTKLVVDTAANLPDASEMENDTIYGELDDGEIATIYLGGYPFYGGGGASSGPVLRRPADGATIDMGQTTSGTVSKTINVKGKSLTQALTIQLNGTGYSFGTTQPSGVTRDSSTQLTVTAAAANALNGVDIVVVYTGSDTDEEVEGTLGISSAAPDSISTEATLVANAPVYEDLRGVKLTGTQWLQTDYCPGPNTEFSLKCKFTENSNTSNSNYGYQYTYFLCCPYDGNKRFSFYNGQAGSNPTDIFGQIEDNTTTPRVVIGSNITLDNSFLNLVKGTSGCTLTFLAGGTTQYNLSLPIKSTSMSQPMAIGYLFSQSAIYGVYDLTIYELIISENGVERRHYVPKTFNGVPGLYDTVTNTFISSETNDELVAIPLT